MNHYPKTGDPTMNPPPDLSIVVVPLLKDVVYQNENPVLWNSIILLRGHIQDYVAVLGLELLLDEAEGYAFLRSKPESEGDTAKKLPRLVARRPLSYPVSLLLALLRKKQAEFDATGGDTRLILSRDDAVDLIRIFLPSGSDETKLIHQIDAALNKIVELGFIRRLKENDRMFEVRRILKAFVDAQWLLDFERRLAEYAQLASPSLDTGDG